MRGEWAPIAREQVAQVWRTATALVLPSTTASDGDQEGTPVVLMEAQATGLPCITTEHAGNAQVLAPGAHPFVVPESDIDALAGALVRMSTLPLSAREALQHEGRNWIEEAYDITRTVDSYDHLYRRLVNAADC